MYGFSFFNGIILEGLISRSMGILSAAIDRQLIFKRQDIVKCSVISSNANNFRFLGACDRRSGLLGFVQRRVENVQRGKETVAGRHSNRDTASRSQPRAVPRHASPGSCDSPLWGMLVLLCVTVLCDAGERPVRQRRSRHSHQNQQLRPTKRAQHPRRTAPVSLQVQ